MNRADDPRPCRMEELEHSGETDAETLVHPSGRVRGSGGLLRVPVSLFCQLPNYPGNRFPTSLQSRHKGLPRDAILPFYHCKMVTTDEENSSHSG